MCYAVFIATSTPQQTTEFVPDVTKLHLELPADKELMALKDKFTLPYIYYVGSDTKCSCGFEIHSEYFDDPDWEDRKASPQALLDLLNELTTKQAVEYYCCWDGDWAEPIDESRSLNAREITLDKNYFELIEREFIQFKTDQNHVTG